jgi:ornithine decarboxylase
MSHAAQPNESACSSARSVLWRDLVGRAVEAVGTPCYVASWQPVQRALDGLQHLNGTVATRSWLSFKTQPLPHLAVDWIRSGRGIEVVSESELATACRIGCPIDQLLVNGVAKHAWLHRHALRRLRVQFDSLREIDALLEAAIALEWRVGIRCHVPLETDARDPAFGGQFGMSSAEAAIALRRLIEAKVSLESIHFHLGQGQQDPRAYADAVAYLAALCASAGARPRFVDCGGGLPAADDPRSQAAIAGLKTAVDDAALRFPDLEEVWLENGRYISGQSAVLAVRVLDIKQRNECRYLICDGGRTNHALAADQSPHPILPLFERSGITQLTTICGPTCMTDDRLGRYDLTASIEVGDVLIWLDAGAYHLPWETRFSHGLCAVVWHGADGRLNVAREREQPGAWSRPWLVSESCQHA